MHFDWIFVGKVEYTPKGLPSYKSFRMLKNTNQDVLNVSTIKDDPIKHVETNIQLMKNYHIFKSIIKICSIYNH